jgi:hypothetical protein
LRRLVTSAPVPLSGFDPLSGFLAGSSFTAVFHAATVSGILPSESSPRWRSLTPLEAAWLPCSYPPACRNVRLSTLSPLVSPTPTPSRGRLVPPTAMGSLFTRKRASRSPWISCRGIAPFRQLHLLRSFTPSSKSVHDWLGFPLTRRPILSWVSAPLELSPSTPRILDPSRPEGLNTNSCLAARDSKDRGPTCQVRPSRFPKAPVRTSRRIPASLRGQPAPPLDGVSFSLDLGTPGKPFAPGLRSF